ncbi:MAG: response regulator [Balneolales bacterium]|nr:response regulator [Balneolales bacterium]
MAENLKTYTDFLLELSPAMDFPQLCSLLGSFSSTLNVSALKVFTVRDFLFENVYQFGDTVSLPVLANTTTVLADQKGRLIGDIESEDKFLRLQYSSKISAEQDLAKQRQILSHWLTFAAVAFNAKKKEQQLQQLKEKADLLRMVLDHIPISVYTKDMDMRKTLANKMELEIVGASKEEDVIGKNDSELLNEFVNMGLEHDSAVLFRGESILNLEIEYVPGKWGIISKLPLRDQDGNIKGLLGITVDITEKKKKDRQMSLLKDLINNTSDAVHISFEDGRFFYLNQAVATSLGISQNDASRYKIQDFDTVFDRPGIWKRHVELLKRRHPEPLTIISKYTNKKSRQDYPVEIKVRFLELDGIGYIIANTRDISQQQQKETELRKAKELAEAANSAKSEFLSNISHEIRTPLNGVLGFCELLAGTSLNETQHNYLSFISSSGKSLLAIIEDILDFSRIEAKKLVFNPEQTHVSNVCEDVIRTLQLQHDKPEVRFILNIREPFPECILVDRTRLRQVLLNLAHNAVKFTEIGYVEIFAESVPMGENKVKLYFAVKDTGHGIPSDKISSLFNAFVQLDNSLSKKYGGTGLGLSICKRIIEAMGGNIDVSSLIGEGSIFSFSIEAETCKSDTSLELNTNIIKIKKAFTHALLINSHANEAAILEHYLQTADIDTIRCKTMEELISHTGLHQNIFILADYEMVSVVPEELMHNLAEQRQLLILNRFGYQETALLPPDTLQLEKPSTREKLFNRISFLAEWRLSKNMGIHQQDKVQVDTIQEKNKSELDSSTSKKFRILIVEDVEMNRKLLSMTIKRLRKDIEIDFAENGLEAVRFMQNNSADLIFMDIQMPLMDGIEATRQLRSMGETCLNVPIIAVTAGVMNKDKDLCLEAGMNDFIAKPFSQERIHEALNTFL